MVEARSHPNHRRLPNPLQSPLVRRSRSAPNQNRTPAVGGLWVSGVTWTLIPISPWRPVLPTWPAELLLASSLRGELRAEPPGLAPIRPRTRLSTDRLRCQNRAVIAAPELGSSRPANRPTRFWSDLREVRAEKVPCFGRLSPAGKFPRAG